MRGGRSVAITNVKHVLIMNGEKNVVSPTAEI